MSGPNAMQIGIGGRIRAARERRSVSLRTLARELEISPSALSLIERGRVQTPLARIVDIARRLDVHPRELIEGGGDVDAALTDDSVVRLGVRGQRWCCELGDGVTWEAIDSGALNITTSLATYEPGSGGGRDKLWSHPGEEVLYVLGGKVLLELGDERLVLARGDSIAYSASISHRMSNPFSRKARHLLITSGRADEAMQAGEAGLSARKRRTAGH